MEFRDIKDYCKHCGPGKCPATFKNCNADNCPLSVDIEDLDDDDKSEMELLRDDCRRYFSYWHNASSARKSLENDYKKLAEAYRDLSDQYTAMKNELEGTIDNSITLINSALYDLRDKLKESIKRLEL